MKKIYSLTSAVVLLLMIVIAACNTTSLQRAKFDGEGERSAPVVMETSPAPAPIEKIADVAESEKPVETSKAEDATTDRVTESVAEETSATKDVKTGEVIDVAPAVMDGFIVAPSTLGAVEICASAPMTLSAPAACSYTSISLESVSVASGSKKKLRKESGDVETYGMADDFKGATAPTTVSGAAPSTGKSAAVNSELAGKLTAGEINDFQKWKMWEDISENELVAYREIWKLNPSSRYSVVVQTEQGSPIVDCEVELISKDGKTTWQARTDNTGKAELWKQFDMTSEDKKADLIRVKYKDKILKNEKPRTIENGVNIFKIPAVCDIPTAVDLLFTVDATGSMGDEIAYLQAELVDVMNKVKTNHKTIDLRLGSVFYRDHGDTYVTKISPFSSELSNTNEFIAQQYADGGGDGPEAVDDALLAGINEMKWSANARARLMFVVLDAPPHADQSNTDRMTLCIRKAAEKGIRLIPLVASGGGYDADKSLEYLMRCCALGTNGTYAFLTDHSGVGGSHTAPSTDKYDVETLNQLLMRIIDQFLFVPECNIEQFVQQQEPADTASVTAELPIVAMDSTSTDSVSNIIDPINPSVFMMKCYPNPASDYIWVEVSTQAKEIFLADNSGKIMLRLVPTSENFRIDLTDYPTGVYHLKAWINERWASARIVIARQ